MKHKIWAVAAIFSPLLLLGVLEGTCLPLTQFTFRAWEGVKVNLLQNSMPGPFYPDMDLMIWETTDQRTKAPKTRHNHWITDLYGQRNRRLPVPEEKYGVIVGDSNALGCSLSQEQMLSEVLTEKTGFLWVNLGYEYIEPWSHPICQQTAPSWIVYELKRGNLPSLSRCGNPGTDPARKNLIGWTKKLDHMTKMAGWNRLRSLFSSGPINLKEQTEVPHLKILVDLLCWGLSGGGKERGIDVKGFRGASSHEILVEYTRRCEENGTRFIIVVLPDTVREADPMIRDLEKAGCQVAGFLPNEKHPDGADLSVFWQKEDSHWSPEGIRLTADEVMKRLWK